MFLLVYHSVTFTPDVVFLLSDMTVRKLQLMIHSQDRIREEHTQLLCIGSIHRERPPAQPQNNQQRLSPEFLPLPPNWSPCFLLALLYYPHSNQDDSFKTSVTSCHFSPAASHHLQAQCNLAQISSELTSHPIPLPHHMPAAPAPWRFLKYTSMFPPHSHKDIRPFKASSSPLLFWFV